jgi:hypothetical protein
MEGASAAEAAHLLPLYRSAKGAAPPKRKKMSNVSQFETAGWKLANVPSDLSFRKR